METIWILKGLFEHNQTKYLKMSWNYEVKQEKQWKEIERDYKILSFE